MNDEAKMDEIQPLHADGVLIPPKSTADKLGVFRKVLNLKTLLVGFAGISLALLITSITLDSYILTLSGQAVKFDRLSVDILLPDTKIGASRIAVTEKGEEHSYKYSDLAEDQESKSADDVSIGTFLSSDLVGSLGFRLPITTTEYASGAGMMVVFFEAVSLFFTTMAIVLQIVFRAIPDSFILRPAVSVRVSVTKREMLKSGLPGFCLLVSACASMVHAVVVSSYVHNFVFRIVAFAIFNSGVDGGHLSAFRVAMKGSSVAAKQEQLKFMQFVGRYLTNSKNVSFGFSFYALVLSIVLNLVVLFTLYYWDNRTARAKVGEAAADEQKGAVVSPGQSDPWKLLPWHCRVRPMWISMNRHPFEVEGAPQSFIDDVVISHTSDYFFSTAGLVDGAVMLFMPLLVMVAISSLDRAKFGSKVFELLGLIFLMRGISVMATIMPTLFNVLQHPQCWERPKDRLQDQFAEKEFCNDLMFSGHTVLCLFPALIFIFSIVHGPYSYKPVLILTVLFAALSLTSLIVVGRLHYTADVVVAIALTTLLVVMNAPVWKLQFSFRKSQLGIGSASAIDKVPSYLELCVERLNLFTVTVQETPEEGGHEESWSTVDVTFARLGDLLEKAEACSTSDEFDDHDDLEELEEDEKKPLLEGSQSV